MLLTTQKGKEGTPCRHPNYHTQMSYDPKGSTSSVFPPSRSASYTPGTQQYWQKNQPDICAKKPDNYGWKIIDKYYEDIVKVLCHDEELCHCVLRSLDEYLLIDQSDREIIECLPLEIKSKAIVEYMSSRVASAKNYIGIFSKFVSAIEPFEKLKDCNDSMKSDGKLLCV